MTKSTPSLVSSFAVRHCFVIRQSSFVIKFTPLFRRSLPCGCALRVPPGERTLFHPRSCPSLLRRPPRSPLSQPYRLPSPLPLSLSAKNPPYTRSRGKFQCALFAGRSL